MNFCRYMNARMPYAMHVHAVLAALCIAPAALHADFAILYSVNCKKTIATFILYRIWLDLLHCMKLMYMYIVYEPNNENVVPAFLCGSK